FNLPRALFFRRPHERAVSHYYYLKKRNKLSDEVSITEFINRPRVQNLYSFYSYNFPVEELVYVGITERYSESIRLFNAIFGTKLIENKDRVNESRPDSNLEIKIPQSDNQDIYNKALQRFEYLLKENGINSA
ncbi:MAG: hypothetical protein KDA74_16665, partial [Planctomycetaceae bacterium]|nr:hypothetical protein [Planctomycetaceae bacterium]